MPGGARGGGGHRAAGLGDGAGWIRVLRQARRRARDYQNADPDGYGQFSGGFRGNTLCYGYTVFNIANPTGAHIHQAPVNMNGPIRVGLQIPAAGLAGSRAACVTLTAAQASAIKANPGAFYVNIHNGAFPNGAIRGSALPGDRGSEQVGRAGSPTG